MGQSFSLPFAVRATRWFGAFVLLFYDPQNLLLEVIDGVFLAIAKAVCVGVNQLAVVDDEACGVIEIPAVTPRWLVVLGEEKDHNTTVCRSVITVPSTRVEIPVGRAIVEQIRTVMSFPGLFDLVPDLVCCYFSGALDNQRAKRDALVEGEPCLGVGNRRKQPCDEHH